MIEISHLSTLNLEPQQQSGKQNEAKKTSENLLLLPVRAVGAIEEIISQKEKEFRLQKQLEKCERQKKRLLNFSHIAAHNLNTYISNIKLLLDLNDIKNHKNNIETLSYLKEASEDLSKTLHDLSDILRIQNDLNTIARPVNVNECLNRVLAAVNGYNSNNYKVMVFKDIPENSAVLFNPAYFESILLNFCTNSIKYAHPDRFPIMRFKFFIEDQKKTLTIADNGLGIDLEKYGCHLFEMYKTFHKHKDAQGIGLYLVKSQIEAMNGTVSAASTVGEGTVFKIVFNNET